MALEENDYRPPPSDWDGPLYRHPPQARWLVLLTLALVAAAVGLVLGCGFYLIGAGVVHWLTGIRVVGMAPASAMIFGACIAFAGMVGAQHLLRQVRLGGQISIQIARQGFIYRVGASGLWSTWGNVEAIETQLVRFGFEEGLRLRTPAFAWGNLRDLQSFATPGTDWRGYIPLRAFEEQWRVDGEVDPELEPRGHTVSLLVPTAFRERPPELPPPTGPLAAEMRRHAPRLFAK